MIKTEGKISVSLSYGKNVLNIFVSVYRKSSFALTTLLQHIKL